MPLEYKSIPFEVKEVIPVESGGWEVSGYASTFGGEPDSYGDVIVAGAFAESIASRATKFLFEHFEPIGKQLEIREDDKGLFGRWSIVDTQTGTDAYKLAKAGVLDSLSIGYITLDDEFTREGVRLIKKVDLFEVSCVAIPANRNAVITDVKSGLGKPFEAHFMDVRVAVHELTERVKSGSDLRAEKGRERFTEARRSAMAAMSGSLTEAAAALDALLAPPPAPPAYRPSVELERRRHRLERLGILERPTP